LPDRRLERRYIGLVMGHMKHTQANAAGVAVPANVEQAFAVTQATWRFFGNDRVTTQALVEPLRKFAREQLGNAADGFAGAADASNVRDGASDDVRDDASDVRAAADANLPYALAVVDWSKIDYKKHTAKRDVVQVSNKQDIGYDLTTQLLVNAQTGQPIAPIQMLMKTADGFLSTATSAPPQGTHHLDLVLPMMHEAEAMQFPATLIHVIDREADSVFHLRAWDSAGYNFLVRCDDDRRVRWRGKRTNIREIRAQLESEDAFRRSRNVTIKGKPGVQYVAETEIVLYLPARRKVAGKSVPVPGEAITLRLVIAKVVDPVTGEELSTWHLLTNVASDVTNIASDVASDVTNVVSDIASDVASDVSANVSINMTNTSSNVSSKVVTGVSAETVALWYYWRWNIESFFKLMKSGGQELEHWQQESGVAILKRLLVASMAVSVVWSLQRDESAESAEFQQVLVRLSGKRLKRGRPPTPGILLSGLFVLLRIFDFLTHINFDLSQITQLQTALAKFAPGLLPDLIKKVV